MAIIQRSSSLPDFSFKVSAPIGFPNLHKLMEQGSLISRIPNSDIKTGVLGLLSDIHKIGFVEKQDSSNSKSRPIFVGCQACVEYSFIQMLSHDPDSVICIVHTDAPTTPLCFEKKDEISPLISPCAQGDIGTQLSVEIRRAIIHDLCRQCTPSNPYNVVYKRSRVDATEGKIYASEEAKSSAMQNAKLQDGFFDKNVDGANGRIKKMTHASIQPELSGASYLYQHDGEWRYFGISSQQAKDAADNTRWAIWDVGVQSEKGQQLVAKYSKVWPAGIPQKIAP